MYRIKAFGKLIGVSPETIRHYERLGILPEAKRTDNGYRIYTEEDKERLQFVGSARQSGLSLEDIVQIIALCDQHLSPCEFVRELITAKIGEIESRLHELYMLRCELLTLQGKTMSLPSRIATACICHIKESDNRN